MDETKRLELARRGELAARPTTAEIYVSPIMNSAAVRFLNDQGGISARTVDLPGTWSGPDGHDIQQQAEHSIPAGFCITTEWKRHDANSFRASLEPTEAWLDYIERMFGREPGVPAMMPRGWEAHREQRNLWRVQYRPEIDPVATWYLWWQPTLDGYSWTLRDQSNITPVATCHTERDIIAALNEQAIKAQHGQTKQVNYPVTIPRNHRKRIDAIAQTHPVCTLKDATDQFTTRQVDTATAIARLQSGPQTARLYEFENKYVVRITDNYWFEIPKG